MKPHRDANELAARLGAAANKPLPLPEVIATVTPPAPTLVTTTPEPTRIARKARVTTSARAERPKPANDTVGITIRPSQALLKRYTLAAADRTRDTGRVVSAQEIMLEQLERGP